MITESIVSAAQKVFGIRTMNPAELALMQWESEEEKARQRAIQQARDYYDGNQTTYLSARLQEILDLGSNSPKVDKLFHLNICDKVIHAIVERLHVTGFSCQGDETENAESKPDAAADSGEAPDDQGDWAWSVWQANRIDALEWEIYEGVRRDGEYFVIVDVDTAGRPRLTPHQRFVDAQLKGDGYGCRAYYPNGDTNQPMERAAKRWVEYGEGGKATQRMTIYYPDRIEKYEMDGGKWTLAPGEDDLVDTNGVIPWVDGAGQPLGIPVIHFRNRGMKCEIDSSVVAMQNLLNKTLVDLAESADQSAFRIFLALGFIPTTDGKALASDGSNRAKIAPNQIIGTTKSPQEASFDAIPAEAPDPLVNVIEKIMLWVARAKDIPASRFQITGQVASGETLKQQDAPLLAVCRSLQVLLGNSWEDCFYMARRLANLYGSAGLDEGVIIQTQWQSPEVRNDDRDDPAAFWTAAAQAVVAGVPIETYLRRMGWNDSDLQDIYDNLPEQ